MSEFSSDDRELIDALREWGLQEDEAKEFLAELKDKTSELSSDDEVLIGALRDWGLQVREAKVLLALADEEDISNSRIQRKTGLYQSEVTRGAESLSERGWVSRERKQKKGMDKALYYYQLAKPFSEIIENIEERERERIREIEENLQEIKELQEECF